MKVGFEDIVSDLSFWATEKVWIAMEDLDIAAKLVSLFIFQIYPIVKSSD